MTTSLSTSKTPGIIVSEIKMMRSFKGVHFLIEGAHDIKFWKLHLKCENVNFVDCGGRKNLIGAVLKIEQAAIPAVAGVYDPDFDRLHGTAPRSPNILVPTDSNDLETTLLRSDALNRLLAIYVDAALLASFESSSGVTVAAHIERTSREFGRLRFLNDVVKHCVDFDELSPYRFMSDCDRNTTAWHTSFACFRYATRSTVVKLPGSSLSKSLAASAGVCLISMMATS